MTQENYLPKLIPLQEINPYNLPTIDSEAIEYASNNDLSKELDSLMSETLTERYQTLMKMRVYDKKTLKETGEALGVSRERARSMQSKAIRKLRKKAFTLPKIRQYAKELGCEFT